MFMIALSFRMIRVHVFSVAWMVLSVDAKDVMHIDRHMQSTDVPLYYICNFKLVQRHYLFIVQSLLRHYTC